MALKVETSEEVTARHDAINKALEGIPEFGDDFKPQGQAAEPVTNNPAGDAPQDSASTDATGSDASPAGDDKSKSQSKSQSERPLDGSRDEKAAEATTFEAPKNWSKERRDAFAHMPAPAQKLLLDVHKEASAGFTKYAQQAAPARQMAEGVSRLFEPHRTEMQAAGVDEIGALQHLIHERTEFQRDPVGFLVPVAQQMGNGDPVPFVRALIEKAGITPQQLFGGAVPPAQQQHPAEDQNLWVDPAVNALQQQLSQQNQQLTSLTQHFRNQQQQAQQQAQFREIQAQQAREREQQTIEASLGELIESADDAGNPKYPHFDMVQDTIERLLLTDPAISAMPNTRLAEKFDRAYRLAVRLHDDLYEQETSAAFDKRLAAARAQDEAQKARTAATRKGGLGSHAPVAQAALSRQDAITKAFGDLGIG